MCFSAVGASASGAWISLFNLAACSCANGSNSISSLGLGTKVDFIVDTPLPCVGLGTAVDFISPIILFLFYLNHNFFHL